jgi:uncharacterized protein (TIGR02246 family)
LCRLHSYPLSTSAPTTPKQAQKHKIIRINEGEATMLRILMIVPVLAVELAMPAAAQPISQQDADQAAKSVSELFSKALHAKDAARIAALYTEDTVRVGPYGVQIGRAEVEKSWTEGFKVYEPEFAKVDRVAVIGQDVVSSVNSWAGTFNSPNGPVPSRGYSTLTEVRDGGGWKISNETWNLTPAPPPETKK